MVLPARDFQQTSPGGRAQGLDDRGYVVAQAPAHVGREPEAQPGKAEGKKVVLQKPLPRASCTGTRPPSSGLVKLGPGAP